MNDSFAVAIVLFAFGVLSLTGFLRARKRMATRLRTVEAAQRDVNALLARRAESLPALLNETRYHDDLRHATDDSRAALQARSDLPRNARQDARIAAEQELSRVVAWLCDEAEDTGLLLPNAEPRLAELIRNARAEETALAAARERYNESADAWNAYRRHFPLGLLARAITPSAMPMY